MIAVSLIAVALALAAGGFLLWLTHDPGGWWLGDD